MKKTLLPKVKKQLTQSKTQQVKDEQDLELVKEEIIGVDYETQIVDTDFLKSFTNPSTILKYEKAKTNESTELTIDAFLNKLIEKKVEEILNKKLDIYFQKYISSKHKILDTPLPNQNDAGITFFNYDITL